MNIKLAANPPTNAETVKYTRNRPAAARSTPPGMAVDLVEMSDDRASRDCKQTYGLMAIWHMALKTFASCPVFALTATGTCKLNRRQYTSGWTSCRC